ncbi:hypothetical protein ACH4UM_41480 [Streptomyces sp. NPDC020801]|uniref:hypothetical protein n=1 Tax=unclassified Streptomyces TaxID=2593676 RepID=UPI003792715C
MDVSEQGGDPSNMISTPEDLDHFTTALFQGRLLPAAQLNEMFTLPKDNAGNLVPFIGTSCTSCTSCTRVACFGAGLMSTPLPQGGMLWGKTGHDLGYANGMFATRDPVPPRRLLRIRHEPQLRGTDPAGQPSADGGPHAQRPRVIRPRPVREPLSGGGCRLLCFEAVAGEGRMRVRWRNGRSTTYAYDAPGRALRPEHRDDGEGRTQAEGAPKRRTPAPAGSRKRAGCSGKLPPAWRAR